jgi:hypothetical protein
VQENPGCPECGYVGWMATTSSPLSEDARPRRSAAGQQPDQPD